MVGSEAPTMPSVGFSNVINVTATTYVYCNYLKICAFFPKVALNMQAPYTVVVLGFKKLCITVLPAQLNVHQCLYMHFHCSEH